MSEKTFLAAATVQDVPAGAKLVVELNGTSIILVNSQDRLYAVRNLCSHAFETLECGRVRGGWISCPVHGARFDMETGKPLNPPATMPIETYDVRVTDGMIEVAI